ncbi:hypothetical protein [Psychrobacter sp. I-STPA10]|uniref:hypothetical protein n=1 Tax=Psychrobacter sp. I-STPA10 TaxID=2585769 RepID=UPI001E2BC80E|nr:hypothetical protein [Psychrobacter sp. I-STPA10]
MKKFVMATMMCIGLGAGNSAMAIDTETLDLLIETMGDTCAITGKVIMTDRLNGVSQQQAQDTFLTKYDQEADKNSNLKTFDLVKIEAEATSNDPAIVNGLGNSIIKPFMDKLVSGVIEGAWNLSDTELRALKENKMLSISQFSDMTKEYCQTEVYNSFQ